jgi:protein TonB
MSAYAQDSSFFTRRAAVFVAIIGVHVVIIWALATGLARRMIETIAPPLQTDIVEEVQKRDEPPPPPPPQLERPPVEVPPPDVTIDIPVETQSTAIQDVTDKHIVAPPPVVAPRVVARIGAKPGKGFPDSEDYYPASSKRLGEEGAATVHACVGPNGKLTEDPTIAKGSGNARLDDGALKLAKAGSGHYVPGTEDGKPATTCILFNVRFQMKN